MNIKSEDIMQLSAQFDLDRGFTHVSRDAGNNDSEVGLWTDKPKYEKHNGHYAGEVYIDIPRKYYQHLEMGQCLSLEEILKK